MNKDFSNLVLNWANGTAQPLTGTAKYDADQKLVNFTMAAEEVINLPEVVSLVMQ